MKLPMPKNLEEYDDDEEEEEAAGPSTMCNAPAYPNRAGSGFIPREEDDFGDGGAYPEIHVAQYPLGLGQKDKV
jgi:SNW domain-containing protein 1